EFALLLPATDAAGALRVAEEVHGQVARLAIPSGGIGAGAVTVSIGIAAGLAELDLYGKADAALYEAKATGRNRTCLAPATEQENPDGRMLRLVSM
ncbi:diguanylate cyclase, partial [Methylobacterium haplocladii]